MAQRYEYRVLPAPRRSNRVKGIKAPEDRFAATIAEVMNTQARDGWEYQRTDILPAEERQGLTGHTTSWQTLLVFRRTLTEAAPTTVAPVEAIPAAPPPPSAPAPPLRATVEEPSPPPRAPLIPERD